LSVYVPSADEAAFQTAAVYATRTSKLGAHKTRLAETRNVPDLVAVVTRSIAELCVEEYQGRSCGAGEVAG
jgi:hypothetical protein